MNIIDTLWLWTYSIIVGWGASFTIIVAILILLAIKLLHLKKRMSQLENRLISAERDFSLYINKEKNNFNCNGFCGEYECKENQAHCKRLKK
jgi:hypothetical protein